MNWALVWTAPSAEHRASVYLAQQNFEHHAFRLRERIVEDGRIVFRDKYMFPRYIFAKVNDMWERVINTPGVVDVVRIGHAPARVPAAVVDDLLSRRDADGYISFGPTAWQSRFRPGHPVRVSVGPLIGYRGVFDTATDAGRVRVLLEMLGAQTPVELKESDLTDCPIIAEQKYRPRRRRPVQLGNFPS